MPVRGASDKFRSVAEIAVLKLIQLEPHLVVCGVDVVDLCGRGVHLVLDVDDGRKVLHPREDARANHERVAVAEDARHGFANRVLLHSVDLFASGIMPPIVGPRDAMIYRMAESCLFAGQVATARVVRLEPTAWWGPLLRVRSKPCASASVRGRGNNHCGRCLRSCP